MRSIQTIASEYLIWEVEICSNIKCTLTQKLSLPPTISNFLACCQLKLVLQNRSTTPADTWQRAIMGIHSTKLYIRVTKLFNNWATKPSTWLVVGIWRGPESLTGWPNWPVAGAREHRPGYGAPWDSRLGSQDPRWMARVPGWEILRAGRWCPGRGWHGHLGLNMLACRLDLGYSKITESMGHRT